MPPKKQNDYQPNSPALGTNSPAPKMGLTNYLEEQQEELSVLDAIYGEDVEHVDAKRAAWGRSSEIAFNIRIRAQSNDAIAVTLCVELPATYPKTFPNLKTKDLECGNPSVPEKLQHIVNSRPKNLLGSAMIHDFCEQIREVLDTAADLKAENEGLESLEEERMVQELVADREADERQQQLLQKRKDDLAEEDRIVAEQVQRELNRRQGNSRQVQQPIGLEDITSGDFWIKAVTFDQSMTTKDMKGNTTLNFRSVCGTAVILKNRGKKVTLVTPITDKKDVQVPQLLLKDIYLSEPQSGSSSFRQKMRDIEELLEHSKVHLHRNVVEILGYKIQRSISGSNDIPASAALWELSILSEYANKSSLCEYLDMGGTLKASLVRSWTHQLLDALEFFDQNGYTHPAVHCGNVLLFRDSYGATTVKLSDGYGTALKALVMQAKEQDGYTSSETPFWTAPEMTKNPPIRNGKTCIWDLGVIMLQMVLGKDVTQTYTSPRDCLNGANLSHPLEEMLERMFHTDFRMRPKAFELPNLAFIHDGNGPLLESESPERPATPYRRAWRDSSLIHQSRSRYESEWVDQVELGKGGFGRVVKARNRMDRQIYAVKIIIGESPADLEKDLGEATLLSRLNHPYVVRYYGAWVEKESGAEAEFRRPSSESEEAVASYGDDPFALPSLGHDLMSTSHPGNVGIQFGDDSDQELVEDNRDQLTGPVSKDFDTNEDNDAVDATDSQANWLLNRRQSRGAQAARPEKSTLYIQMEFCENRTLRHLIRDGQQVSIDDGWRFLRQIVDGLAHIHSSGLVHRDLKPDNIFIDRENNPRIGDFGLATVGQFSAATHSSSALTAGPETRSIGTLFYVAPELTSVGSGQYSAKVDMYSLGIIFFEMCYPLRTYMERDQALRAIRKPTHQLPLRLTENPEYVAQGEIILSLLSHSQDDRPSAQKLLEDGRIPEPLEEQKFSRYLKSIAESDSPEYRKTLSRMFSQPGNRAKCLAWDEKIRNPLTMAESLMSVLVKEKILYLFQRHGATETVRQGIFPRFEYYSKATTFLDESGTVLQLPYDLTVPFARFISRQRPEFDKAFCFGIVYRPSSLGEEPIKHAEVDFDLISQKSTDLALKEAEVIKVLDEIIEEFPVLRSKPACFIINHSDLLDLILAYCKIKPAQYDSVKQILSRLNVKTNSGKQTWQRIRGELRNPSNNIPATSLDDLKRFDFRDDFETAREKLEKILENTPFSDQLAQLLTRIDTVRTYLARFHVTAKVLLAPLSNYSERLFRGSLLFQLMDDSSKSVIAVGGRYDSLIDEFRPKTTSIQTRAVGFQLNLRELLESIQSDGSKTSRFKSVKGITTDTPSIMNLRRCDVLVTSFDTTILRTTGVELVQEMWANGISAELTGDYNSMEELVMAYKKDSIGWIAVARHEGSAFGEKRTRVRSLFKKEEAEVRTSELMSWLRGEIRERNSLESQYEGGTSKWRRISSQAEHPIGEPREQKVKILTPQHRSKKSNRQAIIEAATAKTAELAEQFMNDPVVVAELADDAMEGIRTRTRLWEPESWRTLVQGVPLQDRKYVQELLDVLLELAAAGSTTAWIFSSRTAKCLLYDLYRSA